MLIHTVEIGLHTQFIGEIMDAKADEDILGEGGIPSLEKIKPLLYAPLRGNNIYYGIGENAGSAFSIGKTF
jgi:flavin reductase (DIM6/NTAB) family NADH-FMN oxidoreductase RutF